MRQIRYSLSNENSIDLVFFINGIPIATAELKTDFTQTIDDAKNQYRYDRNPKDPASKREEPLLAFKRRHVLAGIGHQPTRSISRLLDAAGD